MANVELINKLEDWVVEQDELRQAGKPSEWDQNTWARKTECGTACCIAGKAVQLTGHELLFMPAYPVSRPDGTEYIAWDVKEGGMISEVARRELELTEREAVVLFDEDNDLESLQGYFEDLRRGVTFEEEYADDEEDWDDDFIPVGYAEN